MLRNRLVMFAIVLILIVPSLSSADVINGSFESDLSGWQISVQYGAWPVSGGGYSWRYFPDPNCPAGVCETNSPPFPLSTVYSTWPGFAPQTYSTFWHNAGFSGYSAVVGEKFLVIPGLEGVKCCTNILGPDGYTYELLGGTITTVSQDIFLNAGESVLGWAAYATTDFPPFRDQSWIEISGQGQDAIVYAKEVRDVYAGENCYTCSDWEQWRWTAPVTGVYSLAMNIYGDDEDPSYLLVDGVRVAEPSAFILLGSGLAGLASLGWRRSRQ